MKTKKVIAILLCVAILSSFSSFFVSAEEKPIIKNYVRAGIESAQASFVSASADAAYAYEPTARVSDLAVLFYENSLSAIEEIANGKRKNTTFELSFNLTLTTDDLNLPAESGYNQVYYAGEEFFSQNCIPTSDTIIELLQLVLQKYPYDLFWFDKTSGILIGTSYYPGHVNYNNGRNEYTQTIFYTLCYIVSNEYWDGQTIMKAQDPTGAITNYPSGTKGFGPEIEAGREKALSIVKKYEGKSDIEKIRGYDNELAALTDYNYDAASTGGLYGNPWQAVSILDGNPSTKAVCEGYAKAFKYLCDLSRFDDPYASCLCVTGQLFANSGDPQPHMWNIMNLDGQNYLIDVTNDDRGSDAAGELFMKKANASSSVWSDYPAIPYYYSLSRYSSTMFYYYYDSNTLSFFGPNDLILSNKNYVSDGYIKGDCNNDKSVDSDDAIYLLKHTLDSFSYPFEKNGDFNDDKTTDSDDAIYLLKYSLDSNSYPLP